MGRVVVALVLVASLVVGSPASAYPYEAQPFVEEPFGGPYFVTQLYRDLLDREPDASGLAFWVGQLDDGGLNPRDLVAQFVDSPEFSQSRQPVARLYLAAFGRLPDSSGWRFWAARFNSGRSLESLTEEFIATPEGTDRLGADDPDQLIEALYRNVLGRAPDAAGAAHWRGQLDNGMTRAGLVVVFAESPEFRSSADPLIKAHLMYEGLLGRAPEPGGLEFWQEQFASGRSLESVSPDFLFSPEYLDRLERLWCNTVGEDDIVLFDGPEPQFGPGEDPFDDTDFFDDAYFRMQDNRFALEELRGNGPFDEVPQLALDPYPDRQLVISIADDAPSSICLTFLAQVPYPDQMTFQTVKFRTSELEAARDAITTTAEEFEPRSWISSSRGIRLDFEFSGLALPIVDDIITDYGEFLDEVSVGAFPYPMPDPLPESLCPPPLADATQPSDIGLQVDLVLEQSTRKAGGVVAATATVNNTGTQTWTVAWGSTVLAGVGTGPNTEGVFVGAVTLPLNIVVLNPGDSADVPITIGTERCDPTAGHRLPEGSYNVVGTLEIWNGADQDSPPFDPGHLVLLPTLPIQLTHS